MSAVRRFSLMIASLCCAAALVELACRGYLLVYPRPPEPSREERAASPPPPYKDTDYYSTEFLLEVDTHPDVVLPPDGEYALPVDVSGKYINVSGGLRVTTDQPPDPSRRIFVFGGSTIHSHEVPDRYTIPSFIQRSVNASCPERIAVFNYGAPGITAIHQVSRLKTAPVENGDLVVFFDGFNDVFPTVWAATRGVYPEGEDPAAEFGDRAAWGRWIHATANRWRYASALAEVVARAGERAALVVTGPEMLSHNLSVAGEDYRRALLAAGQQVDSAGARFFHFLQPHLFATLLTTPYRRQLADSSLDRAPGVDRGLQAGYSVLEQALAEARQQGVVSVDLSRIFETLPMSDEVFLDEVHVTDGGNEIIAAAIFREIGPALGCRPSTVSRDFSPATTVPRRG